MPRLKFMTACEKVIIDLTTKVPTLIGVFQGMNVPVPDAPLPPKAVSPIKWAVFTLWHVAGNDRNIEYTQHLEILDPAGDLFAQTQLKFMVTEETDEEARNAVEIFGLPISHEGPLRMRVWIEGVEGSESECYFNIRHIRSVQNEQPERTENQPVN